MKTNSVNKLSVGSILGGVLVVVVLVTAYLGFRASGTPENARTQLFDSQRRQDLIGISSNLDVYWSLKHQLPETLTQLQSIRESTVRSIVDPKTKLPYEYRTLGGPAYELCAVFEQPLTQADLAGEPPTPPGENPSGTNYWLHGVGRTCFQSEAHENRSNVNIPLPPPRPTTNAN